MKPTRLKAALLSFALVTGVPLGADAGTFTSFWTFGDSLSDPGNIFAATGGQVPVSPPYAGRFSDGPVWAEYIAQDFAAKGLATGNFAYGLARAVTNDDGAEGLPFQIPDLDQQIALFDAASAGRLGDRPVAAIWIGANDLFAAIGTGSAQAVIATATQAAQAVLGGVAQLAARGVDDVVLLNMAPLELTPAFNVFQTAAAPLAQLGAQTFNAVLAAGAESDVAIVDIDAALRDLIANPAAYGLTDPVLPCFATVSPGQPMEPICTPEQLAGKAFIDTVHPTAKVHAAVADLAREEIAPVPLPPALAMTGTALLALLALGRRRVA
ncbi:SGNH/GDSL hydrolase family protein [Rubellimicrobium roseum]|uniref:SGNH/GDSL hydrolase family protein n=1 Tax=Rubellimicrobium roseum TaxID=687525 RepID=A0A5C4N7U2_9RHOB|nr:SGNH/GDSL hydrolase family protein [Rubellimicrobium roseum]TNC69147.1 SGNH/GDSL hydrolase family protein [Rubellimicrobium roseum]